MSTTFNAALALIGAVDDGSNSVLHKIAWDLVRFHNAIREDDQVNVYGKVPEPSAEDYYRLANIYGINRSATYKSNCAVQNAIAVLQSLAPQSDSPLTEALRILSEIDSEVCKQVLDVVDGVVGLDGDTYTDLLKKLCMLDTNGAIPELGFLWWSADHMEEALEWKRTYLQAGAIAIFILPEKDRDIADVLILLDRKKAADIVGCKVDQEEWLNLEDDLDPEVKHPKGKCDHASVSTPDAVPEVLLADVVESFSALQVLREVYLKFASEGSITAEQMHEQFQGILAGDVVTGILERHAVRENAGVTTDPKLMPNAWLCDLLNSLKETEGFVSVQDGIVSFQDGTSYPIH